MYSIYSYGEMLAHTPRLEAYVAALRRCVNPDSVVLDLGSGPGLFALLACKFGARRVYAVEPDQVIQLARDLAVANGVANRIEFFQNFSTEISLPEPADIIISDLRGVLPWYQRHIPSIIDARRRLLTPGGNLIPKRDVLWAAAVEVFDRHDEIVGPWTNNDLDLSAAQSLVTNNFRKARITPNQLLSAPVCWTTLDYTEIENPDFKAEISWQVQRPGTAHGFCVWFDSELTEGIGFSNNPSEPELIYGKALFLYPTSVEVTKGDSISTQLSADLIGDNYVWRWDTSITDSGLELKANFKQSTLFGVPLSPAKLRKQAAEFKPTLTEQGQIRSFILNSMTGNYSLEEIAAKLVECFPKQYPEWKEALNDVSAVSVEFSQ